MKRKTNSPKLSLTQMDFGAGPPGVAANTRSKKGRKASFFPMPNFQETFKKVLAAIVALKTVRPRMFSASSDGKKARAQNEGEANGMTNPMAIDPDDFLIGEEEQTFGAYNPGGMPTRRNKTAEGEEPRAFTEDDLDAKFQNPRYVAKKLKEEKARRLAAGEALEDIERDLASRMPKKKKKYQRSPMPQGV